MNASPPAKQQQLPLTHRPAGGHHARARRCQSEAPSRHTNHQRPPRLTPSDYGRLADDDYKMGDGGGGSSTHNKENQLLVLLPTDPDTDKEKHFHAIF